MKQSAREILAKNIKLMIDRHFEKVRGKRSRRAWAAISGITTKQAERAEQGQTGATVETLQLIADGIGCEPWQLLFPDFDQRMPPSAVPLSPHALDIAQGLDSITDPVKKAKAYAILTYAIEDKKATDAAEKQPSPRPQPSEQPTDEPERDR